MDDPGAAAIGTAGAVAVADVAEAVLTGSGGAVPVAIGAVVLVGDGVAEAVSVALGTVVEVLVGDGVAEAVSVAVAVAPVPVEGVVAGPVVAGVDGAVPSAVGVDVPVVVAPVLVGSAVVGLVAVAVLVEPVTPPVPLNTRFCGALSCAEPRKTESW